VKRIGLTLLLLGAIGAAFVASSATAGNETSYKVEFDNAFGIVQGSEVRIAGVTAGTVTSLDINSDKKALISFKIDNKYGELKSDATCSAEPQSLIAEYFIDCQPGVSNQSLQDSNDGIVPVAQTTLTVPNDLVLNTLREPFKDRLALLINEFGTALTGNAENLNAAILRGAPALRQLKQVLDILAKQNTTIRDLNANSDTIVTQLNNRREDVVRFINEANDTAKASAERRVALGQTFHLLPTFLAELQPTMRQLGRVAEQGEPLLTELHKATPRLNRFADHLPAFNDAAEIGVTSLGDAAEVGTRALTKADGMINQLRTSTTNAPQAADLVAGFLESIDDPKNAVEEDGRARTDLSAQPGEADRRVALLNQKVPGGGVTEPGYTGMEGLLNYAYYQAGALNQYDSWGHILHLNLVQPPVIGECSSYNSGPTYPGGGIDPKTAPHCVSILGDNQPGIGVTSGPTANLQRYDNSVCPDGSSDLALCDPAISTHGASVRNKNRDSLTGTSASNKSADLTPAQLQDIQNDEPLPAKVQSELGVDSGAPLSQNPQLQQLLQSLGLGSTASSSSQTTQDADLNKSLLDFLFGA
jgi:phospholipid/cholesterol/gamma-HCH transport system substrate-binding protein